MDTILECTMLSTDCARSLIMVTQNMMCSNWLIQDFSIKPICCKTLHMLNLRQLEFHQLSKEQMKLKCNWDKELSHMPEWTDPYHSLISIWKVVSLPYLHKLWLKIKSYWHKQLILTSYLLIKTKDLQLGQVDSLQLNCLNWIW